MNSFSIRRVSFVPILSFAVLYSYQDAFSPSV
jgi:hypothetical protein